MNCKCDFCSGRKRWADNWCGRCGDVKLEPPKWWENMDVCDECEKQMALDALAAQGGGR